MFVQVALGLVLSARNVRSAMKKSPTLRDFLLQNVQPIPIPPLAEQRRIVAKVDALMALCDRLQASLTAAVTTRRRLLDALLGDALAPTDDRELEAVE